MAEDAWEVVGWDWWGDVPFPGGVAVGKPSLHQDPSQIMLWGMSCRLASVVATLSLREPSERLFFLCVLLPDQEPFLTAAEANGGTRSDFLGVPVWSGELNPTSHPSSWPKLPSTQE